jgi:hypothetical protein
MKSKSKNEAKKKQPAAKKLEIDKRKELLARVAGSVAAGLVAAPSPSLASAATMATAAVDNCG